MTQLSQCFVVGSVIVRVGVVLRRSVVGCDVGESIFVFGSVIVRVGVVLRRSVVGCDLGESIFVVG